MFSLFKQITQNFQQINVKNVQAVLGFEVTTY